MSDTYTCLYEIDRIVEDGEQILLVTDFDGTLCPLSDVPSSVAVPKMIIECLSRLSRSPRIVIAIISGRGLDDLTHRVPIPVILAGNHGLAIRGPNLRFEHATARLLQPKLAEMCRHLTQVIAPWKGAWVEDKSLTATVHYRRVNKSDHHAVVRAVRHGMAAFDGLFGMRTGLEAIEIHPRVAWDKGQCLRWIKQRLNMEGRATICMGDDPTDESMFFVNPKQINVKVGKVGRTRACFRIADVFEVASLLTHLERAIRSEDHRAIGRLTVQ